MVQAGLRFGLDRFELAQRRPGIPVPGMAMQQSPLQGMQLGPSRAAHVYAAAIPAEPAGGDATGCGLEFGPIQPD